MSSSDFPLIDPDIQHGKPVIPGTRIPVALIVGTLSRGVAVDEVMAEYGVTQDQVNQCLAYAASLVEAEIIFPLKQTG